MKNSLLNFKSIKALSALAVFAFSFGAFAAGSLPSSVSFPSVAEGGVPVDQVVTFTNDGPGTIYVRSSSPGASKFSIVSDACRNQTLAPAATCDITLTMDTSSQDDKSGIFRVTYEDDGVRKSAMTSVNGVVESVTPDRLSISTTSIDFGTLDLGDRKITSVMFTNTGSTPVNMSSIASTFDGLGDPDTDKIYSIRTSTCVGNLDPFSSCFFNLEAKADILQIGIDVRNRVAAGSHSAVLTFDLPGVSIVGGNTVSVVTNVNNVYPNNLSVPITIERNELAAQKYDVSSNFASTKLVCPVDGSSTACSEAAQSADPAFSGECTPDAAVSATAKKCGLVLKIIPDEMPEKVIKIGITHPLDEGL